MPAVRRALEAMGHGSRALRQRLVSTYFDTPDRDLARRGSTLRVRRRGRAFVQTVKSAGSSADIGFARGEWEDPIAGETPDPSAAQSGPFLLPEIAGRLQPVFRTEVSRLTIPLSVEPQTQIEAAIDRGRIVDGDRSPPTPITEVELELKSGAATALYDVALKLLDIAPLRLETRSKAERGYRLAGSDVAAVGPAHAAPLDLAPDLSAETVLRRAGRSCLDHLLRNEEAACAGSPDAIHQMRVAVRRLRATLSTFAPLLPRDQRRWASEALRWLVGILGEARNLDVFIDGLLPPALAALPPASEFERLALAAARRRPATRSAVAAAIASPRYTQTLLALLRWFEGAEWSAGNAALQQPIGALAPDLLDRCRDNAERRAKHFESQSKKKRHRLRIALKKLRYAVELFGGLYPAEAARHFVNRLKRLQDELGEANDVHTARGIVDGLAPAGRRATGVAQAGRRVLAWHKKRLRKREAEVRHRVAGLIDTSPFWRSAGPAPRHAAPAEETTGAKMPEEHPAGLVR
ncbi:MAG: CHAD domain-containing protein [Alphaproteobacteria bacterium]|nr:CHAD domain-containing protein [Alphaproteobacteria bacterium]